MSLEEMNLELLSCRRCPRLVKWRERVARERRLAYRDWEYWGRPVPGFGDPRARIFVVGLAPGAHGSNRTGRQFTGDSSGNFLYPALYRAGLASQPYSTSRDDGLVLIDLYISAVCRCAPPNNKPTLEEISNCQPYLECEIGFIKPKVIVALGRIAFDSILHLFSINDPSTAFVHGAIYQLSLDTWLVCSYHPSRQNTQTGRLTVESFDKVWKNVNILMKR
jgi:uracil-DNA glycosylase family 4